MNIEETISRRVIWVTPDGDVKSDPQFTNQDHIDYFREAYAKANPPIESSWPVSYKEVITSEGNRWPCIGGPCEGEGIAKVLKMKKGRGIKNAIEVLVPINPDSFTVMAGGIVYVYGFDGNQYVLRDKPKENNGEV